MKLLFVMVFGFILVAGVFSVRAEDGKPPKDLVEKISQAAHDGFLKVKNVDGQTIVKPEDAKNLKYPLVSYDEREKAVARGYLSANARRCGLDWVKDYFMPYKESLQAEHKKNWTPHQYAYLEVIHGMAMGMATQNKKDGACSADEKQRIAALAKK